MKTSALGRELVGITETMRQQYEREVAASARLCRNGNHPPAAIKVRGGVEKCMACGRRRG